MQATRGAVVSLSYTLTDDEGTVIDSSEGCAPLIYLHGYENIIAGLENALEGVTAGYKSQVVVEAADAYGEVDEEAIFEVPREQFPEDMPVVPGMTVAGETPSGDVPLVVVEVNDDRSGGRRQSSPGRHEAPLRRRGGGRAAGLQRRATAGVPSVRKPVTERRAKARRATGR